MKIKINKDTKIFVSVSKLPGNTGSLLHNYGYKILNINAIYFPIKCNSEKELKNILKIKKFGGISVSSPFKSKVIKFLSSTDKTVKFTQSVNTILRKKNNLKGFDTDYYAFKKILSKINLSKKDSICLFGNGSIGRSIFKYLKKKKLNKIYLSSRNKKKYKDWELNLNNQIIEWNKRHKIKSKLLINSTKIGMPSINPNIPISEKSVKNFQIFFDLPINNVSKLKILCRKYNKKYISGIEMSLYQGIRQFEIYTGKKLALNKIKNFFNYIN